MDRLADKVDSPVHGKIAGVYAHAMAIDNLLEYGDGFSRAYQPEPDAVLQSNWCLLLIQYTLTAVLAFFFLRSSSKIRDCFIKGRWNILWNWIGLALIMAFMILLWASMWLRLPPEGSNWLDWLLARVLVGVPVLGIIYTVVIFFWPRKKAGDGPKGADTRIGRIIEGGRERNSGLKEFLPLIALVFLVWLTLLAIGWSVGYISHGDPFNFLFVFLSLCALLVLALNNELFGGLVTFLAGRSIAREFF